MSTDDTLCLIDIELCCVAFGEVTNAFLNASPKLGSRSTDLYQRRRSCLLPTLVQSRLNGTLNDQIGNNDQKGLGDDSSEKLMFREEVGNPIVDEVQDRHYK